MYPLIFDKVIKKIESIKQQSPEKKASNLCKIYKMQVHTSLYARE